MWVVGCLALLLGCQPDPGVGVQTESIATQEAPSKLVSTVSENRGGSLLRKADDRAQGSIAFGSRESANPAGLVLTTEGRQEMPAFPPDSFPSAINDSSYIVEDPACRGVPFMRSIVSVRFVEGTTYEERQAAVEHVDGTVVGGVPLSEQGIYILEVEDDATGAGVCAAEDALDELPTVEQAGPDGIAESHDRRPQSGAKRRDRQREPDPSDRVDRTPLVPPVAPDTLPEGVYNQRTSDSPVISGTFLTNIVLVVFEESSSQSERQAAVDTVNGHVIGGLRHFGDDGYYFVRVEDDHPDTPGQALANAMDLLNSLPQVSLATVELIFTQLEGYRRPEDGQGWELQDGRLHGDSAGG
ncbi:MAG: hypothetical protein ACOC5J_03140 [Gemmatimonadota bacterium]